MADSIYLDPSLGSPGGIQIGNVCYQLIGPVSNAPNTSAYDRTVDNCGCECDCSGEFPSDYTIHIPAGSIPNATCSVSGGTSSNVYVEWDDQDIDATGSCEDNVNGWAGTFNYRAVVRTFPNTTCSGSASGSITLGSSSTDINLTLEGCLWDIYLYTDAIDAGGENDFTLEWKKALDTTPTGTYTEIEVQGDYAGVSATVG